MYIQGKDIQLQWNEEKNQYLKATRSINFDDIQKAVTNGYLLDIVDHLDQKRYPSQKQLHVVINNYIYVVPFVETNIPNTIFLKTVYASRKITKQYKKKK